MITQKEVSRVNEIEDPFELEKEKVLALLYIGMMLQEISAKRIDLTYK